MARPMTREEFQEYLDCFNTMDYDGIVSYFGEDCELRYMTDWTNEKQEYASLKGKQAFKDNYINLHSIFDEKLRLGVFMSTEDTLFVELFTSFTAKNDFDSFRAGPMKKGETFYCNQYIDYDLDENGKFILIRIAQFDSMDQPEGRFYEVS